MVVTQSGCGTLLFGWWRPRWEGVDWARTQAACSYVSPVGPLSAERVRAIGDTDDPRALGRWAHLLAGRIHRSRGPLHTGTWSLTPEDWMTDRAGSTHSAEQWHDTVHTDHPSGFVDWRPTAASRQVLPLRALSNPDTARVKAWRKLARENCLPPVLLWWISGLNCRVVLDGHDRIVAARAEGLTPHALILASARPGHTEAIGAWAVSAYEDRMLRAQRRAADRDPFATLAISSAGQILAKELHEVASRPARTRAWQMPDGSAGWVHQADEQVPGWLSRVSSQRTHELCLRHRSLGQVAAEGARLDKCRETSSG